jgi:hypothetical protein
VRSLHYCMYDCTMEIPEAEISWNFPFSLNIHWQKFAQEQVELLADDDSDTRQKRFLAPHSDRNFLSGKAATPHEI